MKGGYLTIRRKRRFTDLLGVHRLLDEQFLRHQEALLEGALRAAQKHLLSFEGKLRAHMRFEEGKLLPLYAQRAGRIEGGPVEFFLGEHRKMRFFLAKFKRKLKRLMQKRRILKRELITFLDEQHLFKHLMEHHDLREKNILYPALDHITDEQERGELLCEEVMGARKG